MTRATGSRAVISMVFVIAAVMDGAADAPGDVERVAAVLDDWHAAAAAADAERYFGHFAAGGVFMGTDATERWSVEEFREWARPYFERGRAWSFKAVERHLVVRGETAWFDEELETPNLGPCRGSGVLVRSASGWKIAHYNLAVPVPNDIVRDVVSMIAGEIPAPSKQPLELSVMSFNIRFGTADDGDDAWPRRGERVAEVLRSRGADVIGLQEALAFQLDEIDRAMPGHARVGRGRDDGEDGGEFSAVYFDRERFTPVQEGTFWFGETPALPGSKSYGNAVPRICTWVELKDRHSGRSFHVYNVHLDHASADSRRRSVEQLLAHIDRRGADTPVIVTGDFNAAEDSPPVARMTARRDAGPRLVDTYRALFPAATRAGTFHRFTGDENGPRIDYVFAPEAARVLAAAIVRDRPDGRLSSDHFPVAARLRIP